MARLALRMGVRATALASFFLLFAQPVLASCLCRVCAPVACQTVEQTVYVPTMVPERRTINVTECRSEIHERNIRVYRCVPEIRPIRENYTVMIPHVQKRTEHYVVCRPVWEEVDQKYTAMVPHTVVRKGTRAVCRTVPVQETRVVCRDMGHWECQPCGCGDPCCQATCKVWCPKIVQEEIPVTVYRNEIDYVPFQYSVTVCRPEIRVRRVRVCRYVRETKTREVAYTVCRPEVRERIRNVTTYKSVPEQKVDKYRVLVPYTVQKEVTVMVCKMVPKTVTCQVPVPCCK